MRGPLTCRAAPLLCRPLHSPPNTSTPLRPSGPGRHRPSSASAAITPPPPPSPLLSADTARRYPLPPYNRHKDNLLLKVSPATSGCPIYSHSRPRTFLTYSRLSTYTLPNTVVHDRHLDHQHQHQHCLSHNRILRTRIAMTRNIMTDSAAAAGAAAAVDSVKTNGQPNPTPVSTWVGHEGAAAFDLRSEFFFPRQKRKHTSPSLQSPLTHTLLKTQATQ